MIKAISALIALAAAATAEVVVLTPDNFDTVVDGSKPVLVEFYGASK
jgi:protein disulfide-isomerase A6